MIRVNPPFDISKNFWKENYAYRYLAPFDELYNDDKSKDKEESSKLMWSFWLYTSPDKYNPFNNIKGNRLVDAVKKYSPQFSITKYKKYIDAFFMESLSAVAKAFKDEEASLIQRANMLTKIQDALFQLVEDDPLQMTDKDYQGLMSKVDMLRKNTKTVYDQYDAVKKEFDSEQGDAIIYGGGRESFLDKNELENVDE